MTTKSILFAILAALPFVARAENISGAMYTAPSASDTNHPAPTTNANAPYGRVNIDTADQDHIATTAYVKGAYNSAIAGINKLDSEKQGKFLTYMIQDEIGSDVIDGVFGGMMDECGAGASMDDYIQEYDLDTSLITAEAVAYGIDGYVTSYMYTHPITIYTTWDDDSANATTQVRLTGD